MDMECSQKKRRIEHENGEEQVGGSTSHDVDYFRSYADLDCQQTMVLDHTRTHTYKRAILRMYRRLRKVDALISEWMGYTLFSEWMLDSVLHARDAYLKPGGLMFPCRCRLLMAPIGPQPSVNEWKSTKELYGLDMSSVMQRHLASLAGRMTVESVDPETVLAHGCTLLELDLTTVTREQLLLALQDCPFDFTCFGQSDWTAFALWFEVDFPSDSDEPAHLCLSTSPYLPATHWLQTILHCNPVAVSVVQDSSVRGRVSIGRDEKNPRLINVELSFALDAEPERCVVFRERSE